MRKYIFSIGILCQYYNICFRIINTHYNAQINKEINITYFTILPVLQLYSSSLVVKRHTYLKRFDLKFVILTFGLYLADVKISEGFFLTQENILWLLRCLHSLCQIYLEILRSSSQLLFIFCGIKFNTLIETTLKRWWPTKTKSVGAFGINTFYYNKQ